MACALNQAIADFVAGITRGPFKCLRNYDGDGSRRYVEECNPAFGDIFGCAVYQAYLDMCRTVSGAGKGKRKKEIEKTRDIIAEALRDYFAGEPKTKEEAFDGWYGSVLIAAQDPAHLSVGQSQKLLNMAFKYLYCCRDIRESAADHFACCHMALDGYTLAWYKRECDSGYDGEAWSSIDDIAKYFHIVENTRSKVKGASPFLAEFGIWKRETDRAERRELKKWADKIAECGECPLELKNALRDFASIL